MIIPVKWLELRDDGTIVAKVKQKNGNVMPMTVTIDKIHEQYPRYKNITSPAALIGLIKKSQRTFDLPNLKMGKNKRESRKETKREEARWSKC